MLGAYVRVGWHDFIVPKSVDVGEATFKGKGRVLWSLPLRLTHGGADHDVAIGGDDGGVNWCKYGPALCYRVDGQMSHARVVAALACGSVPYARHVDLWDYMRGPGWWLSAIAEAAVGVADERGRAWRSQAWRRASGSDGSGFVGTRVRKPAVAAVVAPRPEQPKLVYLMEAGGRVKIGISTDPERRRQSMQTGCPVRLRLLATIPGGAAVEAEMHARFAEHRKHGEWFEDVPEIRAAFGVLQ